MLITQNIIEIDLDGVLYSICGAMRKASPVLNLLNFSENSLACYDFDNAPIVLRREILEAVNNPDIYDNPDCIFPETADFLKSIDKLCDYYGFEPMIKTWLPRDADKEIFCRRQRFVQEVARQIPAIINQQIGGKTWENHKPYILIEDNPAVFLQKEKNCDIGIMRKWRYNIPYDDFLCEPAAYFNKIKSPGGHSVEKITSVINPYVLAADSLAGIFEACAYALETAVTERKTVDWADYCRKNF